MTSSPSGVNCPSSENAYRDADPGPRGRLVVDIALVVEDPHNERKVFRNMEGLVASVKTVGLIEPITVMPLPNGTYQIITGHRRYRAAKVAGLKTIEIILRDPQEERVCRRKSLVSNVQRENLGPVELAEALRSLLDEDKDIPTQRRLAEVIGKAESWVSDMLRILRLPVPLRQRLQTSEVAIPYDAVAKVARIGDEHHQAALVDDLLAGATNQEIRSKIQALKGMPRKGAAKARRACRQIYRTSTSAVVIVQSQTKPFSPDQCVRALEEALRQARRP